MITGSQIRMARAALGWKLTTVSDRAEISWARLQHIERTDGPVEAKPDVISKIITVFESEGIEFLEETGEHGAGVRAPKRSAP